MSKSALRVSEPSFAGLVGVARRQLSPPQGINARNWGQATNDVLPETHRPLTTTALYLSSESGPPVLLASLDLGWWRSASDEWSLRGPLLARLDLDPTQLLLCMNHTHAGPSCSLSLCDKPGGEQIAPFLDQIGQLTYEACVEANKRAVPGTLSWHMGRCGLAANRDLPDPDSPPGSSSRVLCGYNPLGAADNALLVGRVTDASSRLVATIVNYACHPTTLGWGNRMQSPDWVGAMREIVEVHTPGALCLFLQGASGELAPREQYLDDPDVADWNGRQVGFAVLSTLEGMLPPERALEFESAVESGATLAKWTYASYEASTQLAACLEEVTLDLKPDLPTVGQLRRRLENERDPVQAERTERQLSIREGLGDADQYDLPVWLWRIGDAVLVAQMNEAYSELQIELRQRFPDYAVVVVNLANGSCGYLPPADEYDRKSYQVRQTPFDCGSLESLIEACSQAIQRLML